MNYKLFVCVQCGFEYDEEKGWPEDGIAVVEAPSATLAVRNRLKLSKPGSWFLHCHHLYHMATGMMTEVLVS